MSRRLPSLRWHLAYLRLVGATLLNKWLPPGARNVVRVLGVVLLMDATVTYDRVVARPAEDMPQQAVVWWVAQLIVMAVSYIITAALTPKPKPPEKVKATAPTVEEGTGIEIICGTVWIDDPVVLAFKEVGTKKIKAKGGKKG